MLQIFLIGQGYNSCLWSSHAKDQAKYIVVRKYMFLPRLDTVLYIIYPTIVSPTLSMQYLDLFELRLLFPANN